MKISIFCHEMMFMIGVYWKSGDGIIQVYCLVSKIMPSFIQQKKYALVVLPKTRSFFPIHSKTIYAEKSQERKLVWQRFSFLFMYQCILVIQLQVCRPFTEMATCDPHITNWDIDEHQLCLASRSIFLHCFSAHLLNGPIDHTTLVALSHSISFSPI